jgi:hypothetical protein
MAVATKEVNLGKRIALTQENRSHPRMDCAGTASVLITPGEPVCLAGVVDLSVLGCLLAFHEPLTLERDALVELTFCVNNLPFRVRAQAKSIRSNTRIGFEFPQLRDRIKLQLEDLIEELGSFPRIEPAKPMVSNLVAFPKTGSRVVNPKTKR